MSTTSTSGRDAARELGPDAERVLTADALALVADLHATFEPRARAAAARPRWSVRTLIAKGGTLDFLRGDEGDPRGRLDRSPTRIRALPRPPRRDHRPTDAQDGDQRAELGREGLHGRLRGLELADVGEHGRRAGEPDGRDRRARSSTPRTARSTRWTRRSATLLHPPARLAPHRHATSRSTASRCPGSLMDFGLYLFHNAQRAHRRGQGAVLYLPKMESHLEARLWNSVFDARAGRGRRRRAARSGRRC